MFLQIIQFLQDHQSIISARVLLELGGKYEIEA